MRGINHVGFMEKQAVTSYLLKVQRGICPGCDTKIIHPVLDHDHDTDLVRGVLCGPCNSAEGRSPKDDPFWSGYRIDNPASRANVVKKYHEL